MPLRWYDAAGFEGFYTNKTGKTAEGAATFFRTERYRAVAVKVLSMNKLFADVLADPAAHPLHSQFLPLLQSSPVLVQALSRVGVGSVLRSLACITECALHMRVTCKQTGMGQLACSISCE
jgi:hypothetical protein